MKKFGWIPDVPDVRDYKFCSKLKATLPKSVNLKRYCSPVEDQGALGSCTANSGVGALEFLFIKQKQPFFDFSRLFLYYYTRLLHGTVFIDSGASIRNTVKAMKTFGVCCEEMWPYSVEKFKTLPPVKCTIDALQFQALRYERLSSLYEMKACLASGFPFTLNTL